MAAEGENVSGAVGMEFVGAQGALRAEDEAVDENQQLQLARVRNYWREFLLLKNTLSGARIFFSDAEADE